MSFSLDNHPMPLDWITNPTVILELNRLFTAMKNNTSNIDDSLDDWECRVAQAMSQSPPCPEPQSWLGCDDIVRELNRLYRNLHNLDNSSVDITDWECRVADSMYDWAGMENFFNINQQFNQQFTQNQHEFQTPPQSPSQNKRKVPGAPKKKNKRHKTKH